jgi:hypothetical protein
MTRSNVIQFAAALQRHQAIHGNRIPSPGAWDWNFVAGIDGIWAEPPAMGVVVPFRAR